MTAPPSEMLTKSPMRWRVSAISGSGPKSEISSASALVISRNHSPKRRAKASANAARAPARTCQNSVRTSPEGGQARNASNGSSAVTSRCPAPLTSRWP